MESVWQAISCPGEVEQVSAVAATIGQAACVLFACCL
jgi:hypothetical protein